MSPRLALAAVIETTTRAKIFASETSWRAQDPNDNVIYGAEKEAHVSRNLLRFRNGDSQGESLVMNMH
jgi:hypothetical protein